MIPTKHNIIDQGVEHPDYFQGAGVYGTEFSDIYTGIGDSAYEALEDALDNAAENGWKIEDIKNDLSKVIDVPADSDSQHYVSILLKSEDLGGWRNVPT
jgi:hypothetical protein